jgi:hypothetical protein
MRRIQVGRHVRVIAETADGVQLEGAARLQPGQVIDLLMNGTPGAMSPIRRVFVLSWTVARLGSEGPTYVGQCRWQ